MAGAQESAGITEAATQRARDLISPLQAGLEDNLSNLRAEIEGQRTPTEVLQPLVDFDAANPLAESLLTAAQTPGDTSALGRLTALNRQPGIEAPQFSIQDIFNDPNFQALDAREQSELAARFASIGKSLSGEAFEADTARRSGLARSFAGDQFSRDMQSAEFARGEKRDQIDAVAREAGITQESERQAFNKLIAGVGAQQNITESEFNRLVQTIATEQGITADRLNQLLTLVNISQQAAMTGANIELGLGSNLTNLRLQEANAAAAGQAATGQSGRFLINTALDIASLFVPGKAKTPEGEKEPTKR